ncbi:hypothetical protein PENCOP_c001G07223 [Penicillium coprophilum]|uniref:Uncharacterized protein n=1 Tax=Penicillium coprophilum TaxID=36646 RepID=A0A1V6V6E4_9EURO|nr:hypothetical protein PENCOP_c001G07223 [Penicillium coprophilum]
MVEATLKGQVGVVTGAGSAYGIGRSIVLAAAKSGAKVVYACDISSSYFADLQETVKATGCDTIVECHVFDISSEEQTLILIQHILKNYGRLDFYFANAGFVIYRGLNDLSVSQFERAMAVMQTGTFLALKYGSQAMSVTSSDKPVPKGNIVVTSSCATLSGAFADMAYTTAKNGCNGLVRSGSVQLSSSNIRVNAVAPGPVATSLMSTSRLAEEGVEYKLEKTVEEIQKRSARIFEGFGIGEEQEYYYNRCSAPEEIANVAIFLASDLASAMNGQIVVADNGKTVAATGEAFTGPVPPINQFKL